MKTPVFTMKNDFRPSSPPASPPQLLFPHWIATSKRFRWCIVIQRLPLICSYVTSPC